MTHSVRKACVVVACVIGTGARQSSAQAPASIVTDSAALEFHGFRAGQRLSDVAARVRRLEGTPLRCQRAKADRRITECRGRLRDPDFGGSVDLWLSAIDSVAGVLTVSGGVAADQLDAWRNELEAHYGRVGAKVQGPQWMMQWVRRGRMIRLTWRVDRGEKVASVSLVDGRVLDAWGRERARRAGQARS